MVTDSIGMASYKGLVHILAQLKGLFIWVFWFRFQLACERLKLSIYVGEAELRPLCKMREMASMWTMNFNTWMDYTLPQKTVVLWFGFGFQV